MGIRATLLCLLLVIFSAAEASARGTVEIVQQQGLFLLQDFQQWVAGNYQYSGHTGNGSSSSFSSQRLEELYHAQAGLAILNPHFINFILSGDVGYDQLFSSSDKGGGNNGNSGHYQYNVEMSALDRSWHPFQVFSSRTLDNVVTPYSPTFNTTVSRNGVATLFSRNPYTLRFRYETNTQDVTGGGTESTSTSDSFQASFGHRYKDINVLNADFGLAAAETEQSRIKQTSNINMVNASDTFYFGNKRDYSLISEVQRQYTVTSSMPQETLNWNETLNAHLGKALDGEVDYRYSGNRTTIFGGQEQLYNTNNVTAQLRHHLFLSVDTFLSGTYGYTALPSGTENRYSGRAGMMYRKQLPALSKLTFGVSGEHEVTDRKGATNQLRIQNESHTVTDPNQVLTLKVAGALQEGTVIIEGFLVPPATPQTPPNKVFIEGIDYTVDYPLGRITWGPIPPSVPNLVITYTVQFNPSVTYATDSLSLSSSLSLFNGRYILSGAYMNQSRTLLDGAAQNGLFSSQFTTLRGQKLTDTQSYTIEYSRYAAGPTRYQYIEGGIQYTPVFPEFSFQAEGRDRYTIYEASPTTPAHTDNTLSASASFNRSLFGRALFLLSLNLVDERGEKIGSRDSIFLRSSVRTRFNKLAVSLVGSSGFRFSGSTRTRDDNLRVEVLRTF